MIEYRYEDQKDDEVKHKMKIIMVMIMMTRIKLFMMIHKHGLQ